MGHQMTRVRRIVGGDWWTYGVPAGGHRLFENHRQEHEARIIDNHEPVLDLGTRMDDAWGRPFAVILTREGRMCAVGVAALGGEVRRSR